MFSDNGDDELVAFAVKIGLKPKWIQTDKEWIHHFDITANKRRKAIIYGATPLTTAESRTMLRKRYREHKKGEKHERH